MHAQRIAGDDLDRYLVARALRWALRYPLHDYPPGMPASRAMVLEARRLVVWMYDPAGFWRLHTTPAGDQLLEQAAALEDQYPWLKGGS